MVTCGRCGRDFGGYGWQELCPECQQEEELEMFRQGCPVCGRDDLDSRKDFPYAQDCCNDCYGKLKSKIESLLDELDLDKDGRDAAVAAINDISCNL